MTAVAVRQIMAASGSCHDAGSQRRMTIAHTHRFASNTLLHCHTGQAVSAVATSEEHVAAAGRAAEWSRDDETQFLTGMNIDIDIDMVDPGWDLLPCTDTDASDEAADSNGIGTLVERVVPIFSTLSSPVFSCGSPALAGEAGSMHRSPGDAGTKRAREHTFPYAVKKRPRVRFGAVAQERRLVAETGAATTERGITTTTDIYVPLKQHDGPSRISLLISALLITFFGNGASVTSVEQLLRSLRPEHALEICERGDEVYDVCSMLVDRLEAGGCVGLLPSNVRLTAVHRPGVLQLAAWLRPQSSP